MCSKYTMRFPVRGDSRSRLTVVLMHLLCHHILLDTDSKRAKHAHAAPFNGPSRLEHRFPVNFNALLVPGCCLQW